MDLPKLFSSVPSILVVICRLMTQETKMLFRTTEGTDAPK